jgi:hypothetical protein
MGRPPDPGPPYVRPRFEAPAAERTPSVLLAEAERLVTTTPPPMGEAVFAPLHKPQRAAPPPGFYPARGPRLAAPSLGPRGPGSDHRSSSPLIQRRRSPPLRSASTGRRYRGSTLRAARVPAASLLGPHGPGSDPPVLPINLCVALRARGPAGPAATTPPFSCDHLRGGRVLRPRSPPPPMGGGAVFAPLHKRTAPPSGFYPARGPRLASRAPWARLGPPVSLSSTTVAAVVFAPLRLHAAPPPGLYPARGPPAVEATAPPPSSFLYRCRPAPLRVTVAVDEHRMPQEEECLRSTTYPEVPDCRRCLFAGVSWRRCPRAGPAGPLRRGRGSAAPAVPLPLLLRSTAGGRRRALPAPRWAVSPFDHVPRLSSLPICRGEQEPLPGPRAGPAGPLCYGRCCPAALAVPLPLPLRSTAGGRQRALPTPRGGVSPFDHVPRLSLPSMRRGELEPLPPDWARRSTAPVPLPRRPRS